MTKYLLHPIIQGQSNTIIQEICSGIDPEKSGKVSIIEDRRKQLIKPVSNLAQSGDIVLIAGKGHEKYQIIGEEKFHFDDLEETIKIFKKILNNAIPFF